MRPGVSSRRLIGWPMLKSLFSVIFLCFLAGSPASAGEWREAKSEHFIVYSRNAPARFIQSLIDGAEKHYRKTTTTLGFTRYKGWIWDERVKIYVYDDAGDYQKSHYGCSGGTAQTGARLIMTYPSARGFFDSVLPHELGHIVFRDFIGPKARVPLWLEEGVAMAQEETGAFGADDDVRRALKEGTFIPLPDLDRRGLTNNSDRAFVDLFYAEAASVVDFLITQGEMYRFARLCREMKDGRRFEWALKKAYMKYQTLGDLDEAWRTYLGHSQKERH